MIDISAPHIQGRLVEYRRHSDSAPRTGKIMMVQKGAGGSHVLVQIRGISVAAEPSQLAWPSQSVAALRPREAV